MSKPVRVVLGVAVALVVIVAGLAAFSVLRDSAEDEASLSAIAPSTVPGAAASNRTSPVGDWKIAPGASVFVGYRVHEKLRGLDKEVTGRTPEVTGTMTIAGQQVTATQITAGLAALSTDDPLRDSAVKRTGLETNAFPQASFTLTEPIPLGGTPTVGREVPVTAKGNLTLHGVSRPVSVPMTAAWDGDQIRTVTSGGGVRVQFQDYGFDALKVPVAETDDFGFFELQLVWVPA